MLFNELDDLSEISRRYMLNHMSCVTSRTYLITATFSHEINAISIMKIGYLLANLYLPEAG